MSADLSILVILFSAKSFPFPDSSSPKSAASAKSKLKPLLPNVKPEFALGIHTPLLSVSPKHVGASCYPSTKTACDIYPSYYNVPP